MPAATRPSPEVEDEPRSLRKRRAILDAATAVFLSYRGTVRARLVRVSTTLRASGVTLRPLLDGEVDQLVAVLAQPGVREWWGPRDDPEHEREGLRNGGAAFAIEVQGALAGWLGYNEELDPDYRYASLDIFLAPEYQGRGLGRLALRLAAGWLFDKRGHHRLTIDPARANTRAISAYEAVGFHPVGVMRRYERGADGNWHDNLLMDLLRDELRAEDRPTRAAS